MNNQKLYQIALTMINGVGDVLSRQLLQLFHTPEAIFRENFSALEKIPGISSKVATEIKNPALLERAEAEMEFAFKNDLLVRFLHDEDYPYRLKECPDAPLVLYTKGNMDLNTSRIISIVGTRRATPYGVDLTNKLLAGLSEMFPGLLIVSGLAYGIDICAHQAALKERLPTVAVLAHGLDRIYPSVHRNTAVQMLEQGGLVTEFPIRTNPDRPNFVMRNRIVAGMADATIVIESADKGGSLITADIAFSYGRDVLAFPGRIGDHYSAGCNRLIQANKAALITSASDLADALCWERPSSQPVQTNLLFTTNEEGNKVLTLLREKEELHINQLALELDKTVQELSNILFELEMEGYIRNLPGSRYRLVLQ